MSRQTDWTLDLNLPYDPHWHAARRVMYLYEKIIQLDSARPVTDHHATVLATLGKAVYILHLRDFNGSFREQQGYPRIHGKRVPLYVHTAIPYEAIEPIDLLLDIVQRYPNDPEADRLAYLAALWTEQLQGHSIAAAIDFQKAAQRFTAFLQNYPKSRWASAAREQLDILTRPSLGVGFRYASQPGRKALMNVFTRNVSQVRFTAYRVHLESILGHTEQKDKDGTLFRPSFNDLERHFHSKAANPAYHAEKMAEWTVTTGNNSKYNEAVDHVTTPLDTAGAYIVEARAGESDQLRATALVIVTDITIVQRVDRDSVLAYVTDSATGKPLPGVKLTVWKPVHIDETEPALNATYANGTTDSEGQFRMALSAPEAQVFAYAGDNRYAISGIESFYSRTLPEGERAFRALIYTDRPLYRPAQTVNMRVVMAEGRPGAYRLAAGKEALLTVTGPRGELLRKNITMGARGSFNDSFTLPARAELGEWTVQVQMPEERKYLGPVTYGTATFRVEEYKKPEFTVTVTPDKAQVRVGEPMQMTISGKYFFGGPVANAKVHYKVIRSSFIHPLPFQPRLDWFEYESPRESYYRRWGRLGVAFDNTGSSYYGAVYLKGDLTTDAAGMGHLVFSTKSPQLRKGYRADPGLTEDQSFTVTAEVVDSSRRQVTGSGEAHAVFAPFRAALHVDRKFLLAGDTLQIEGRTLNADDTPVAASGEVNIYRRIPAIPEQKRIDPDTGKWKIVVKYVPAREELAATTWLTTDVKEGKGFAFWHSDTPADYRLEYVAKDDRKHEISAGASVLVYGPNFDSRLKKDDGRFEVIPEFAEYRPGDTARVLVVAPTPDSYILFTEAATGCIVRSRSLFVPGRSTIVNVPISDLHVPNARFAATLVQDGTVQEQKADVVVPPENHILSLTLTPDKADYKPGEHVVFTLHAVGTDGRPVQGEISLGVVDAALLAMQPDQTPDIRNYFYGYQIPFEISKSDSTQNVPMLLVSPEDGLWQFPYETHVSYPEGMGWARDSYNGQSELPSYTAYDPPHIYDSPLPDFGGGFGGGGIGGVMGGRGGFEGVGPMKKGLAGAVLVEATVRSKFLDTAFWMPAVVTDAQGNATVSFDFPDNLTKWTIVARGVTGDVQVGFTEAQTVTKKNLLVRLQAPRFFVDRDQVTLSANIHNYLSTAKSARVELVTDGSVFALLSGTPAVRTVQVEKDGGIRVDWTVDVKKAGSTKIKVIAQTDEESDAAELSFPVLVHGVEKFVAQGGVLHDGGEATLTYDLIVPKATQQKSGQVTEETERVPLEDGAMLASGDIIEVELHLKSDNDYDYVVFEDMKPAGCEAMETRSGTAYGDGLCSNFELRDEKVAFFIDTLPQGERRITYKLRAEIPGKFHVLPTNAYAMYTPDIRALSDEFHVTITDAPVMVVPKAGKARHK